MDKLRYVGYRVQALLMAVRYGLGKQVWHEMRDRNTGTTKTAYGFRRDLSVPSDPPPSKLPFTLQKMTKAQLQQFSRLVPANPDDVTVWLSHYRFMRANLDWCYIALVDGKEIGYIQAAMECDNPAYFAYLMPKIQPNQALFEGVYVPHAFRGKGLNGPVMASICSELTRRGLREGITFIAPENIPSIRGALRAGFDFYLERTTQLGLFSRSTFRYLEPDEISEIKARIYGSKGS